MASLHQIIFVKPAILVAAETGGSFSSRGLGVETTFTRSSVQQRDGLLSGSYDVALTAMDNVISWSRDTGSPFRVVAQIERTTQLELFGREPFRQLESLRGARLAVDAPDSGFVLVLRGALDAAGVGPRDYSLVPCGGVKERLDALLAGTADAGLLGPPLTAVAAKAGLYRIANIESVFPDYPGLGAVICQDRSQAIRLALSAYVSALKESLKWMRDRPAELAAALAEANFPHESIDRVLETRPDTLCPSLPGLQRILSLRQRYDPQFDFRTMPDDLLDSSLLAA